VPRGLSPAESAGLYAAPGDPATPHAITAAAAYGGDLTQHRAQPVTDALLAAHDAVYCMTPSHLAALTAAYPAHAAKCQLLDPNGIPDPYGGDLTVYEATAAVIARAVKALLDGSPASFALVRLNDSHIDALLDIETACFTVPWSRAAFASDLDSPFSFWYGVLDTANNRLAAFLGTQIIADEAEIRNVATHPDYRRRGLAEAMLRAFFALHPDLTQTFLEVRTSNVAARTLYEKLGFTAYAVRRDYYEKPVEDAILMRRDAVKE